MDIAAGKVVKGVEFQNLREAGNAVELAKRYYEQGVDELVFLDITATVEGRKTFLELVRRMASCIFIPFTVGGGLSSVEQIRNALRAGADKVSIGSAAVFQPELVRQAAREFGRQCVVISVDAKKENGQYFVYTHGGRRRTSLDAFAFAKKMEWLGAGEILLNAIHADGTQGGYDVEFIRRMSETVRLPVIASGGAGCPEHLHEGLTRGKADAVLIASILHFGQTTIPQIKEYLKQKGEIIR
jgi:cyclase